MFKNITVALLAMMLLLFSLVGCDSDDDDDNDDNDDQTTPANDDDQTDDDAVDDDQVDDDTVPPAPTLKVGAARIDITPEDSKILGGYGMYFLTDAFCRWSTGVHDPLYAIAIAFENEGDTPVIQIAIDAIGLMIVDIQPIQDGVAAATGIPADHVLVSASHSHGTPDTVGMYGVTIPPQSGRDDEYVASMIQGAIQAGTQAFQERRSAIVVANWGYEPNYHFNFVYPDDPEAVVDSTMTILGFYEPNGELIGTMMNWGSHPTILPPDNTLITADFVGGYFEAMDAELGAVNMFLQGNIGASVRTMNAYQPFEPRPDGQAWGTFDDAWRVGYGLADTAVSLLENGVVLDNTDISLTEHEVWFKLMNPFFKIVGELGLIARDVPALGESAESRITVWRLGPVVIGTVPGEAVPKLGLELRDIMDGDYEMIVNLGQDWVGYLMYQDMFTSFKYIDYLFECPGGDTADQTIAAYEDIFGEGF